MSRRKRRAQRSSNQRRFRANRRQRNANVLRSLVYWLIPVGGLFLKSEFHGNIKWNPESLIIQAVIWSWQDARYVTDAFSAACGICDDLKLEHVAKTYTAFLNALSRYADQFVPVLRRRLQALMEEVAGRFWRNGNWVLLAVDGSRTTAPRTVSNETAFCAPNYGKGKTARYRKKKSKGMRRRKNERNKPQPQGPQIWITLIWHMSLRLPWTWRLGPSNSSEREHLKQILKEEKLPANMLLCGDAGFVGYELWKAIQDAQGDFLIRVGANVSLLREHADYQQLQDGEVLCWPKGKIASGEKPLRLRLVRVKIGKTRMWMLTNVLSRKKLTIRQIVQFYRMRWGIEVEFRGLKQTLDKHTLRCRNSTRAYVELDWSIRAMAFAELLAMREQTHRTNRNGTSKNKSPDPKDRSLAETMRALRTAMRAPHRAAEPGLLLALAQARVQRYRNRTNKKSRYRPPNPDKKPLGNPKIRKLRREELEKLRELERRSIAA
jgi:hypothetical protein